MSNLSVQIPPIARSIHERTVLIDTCAIYAIYDDTDWHHDDALACREKIREADFSVHISVPTICEAHSRFIKDLGLHTGHQLLEDIYDGSYSIERVSEQDEKRAIEYLAQYEDQKLSLTDALNWVVMARRGIFRAFTFDWHYRLEGFLMVPPLYLE